MKDAFMFMHAGIRKSFNINELKLEGQLIYNIIHQIFLLAERQMLNMHIILCPGQASKVGEFIT
jgi:hypothetical protein